MSSASRPARLALLSLLFAFLCVLTTYPKATSAEPHQTLARTLRSLAEAEIPENSLTSTATTATATKAPAVRTVAPKGASAAPVKAVVNLNEEVTFETKSEPTEEKHEIGPLDSPKEFGRTALYFVGFGIITVAAYPLGMLFPTFLKLPLITGYLIIGVIAGPFVADLLQSELVARLTPIVNAIALSFISFQAGHELYYPELKPHLKSISIVLGAMYLSVMILVTVVLTLAAGPFFYGSFSTACQFSIALMFASIAVLGSPATALAIHIEQASAGPFTNLMLGVTMTAEFVVLVSFSVSRIISSIYCAKLPMTFGSFMFTFSIVFANVIIGAIIGYMIVGILSLPSAAETDGKVKRFFCSLGMKGFIWMVLGFSFFNFSEWLGEYTLEHFGMLWQVKFEPLLVLMVASCLAGHKHVRHDMHIILDAAAPYMFLPFFTMTGAGLKLNSVLKAIPLMSVFVVVRWIGIFVGCYIASRFVLKMDKKGYNNLWLTLTPQAGVALGLANEVLNLSKDEWVREFSATIIAAVVLNQMVGPVLCAAGIKGSGESGMKKGGSGHGDHGDEDHMDGDIEGGHGKEPNKPIRHAAVVGEGDIVFEVASRLCVLGARVRIPLFNSSQKLAEWKAFSRGLPRQASENVSFVKQMVPSEDGKEDSAVHEDTDLVVVALNTDASVEYCSLLKNTFRRSVCPKIVAITSRREIADRISALGGVITIHNDTAVTQQLINLVCPSEDATAAAAGILLHARPSVLGLHARNSAVRVNLMPIPYGEDGNRGPPVPGRSSIGRNMRNFHSVDYGHMSGVVADLLRPRAMPSAMEYERMARESLVEGNSIARPSLIALSYYRSQERMTPVGPRISDAKSKSGLSYYLHKSPAGKVEDVSQPRQI